LKPAPANPKEEWKLPTFEQTVNPLCKYHISLRNNTKLCGQLLAWGSVRDQYRDKPYANRWITSGNKKIDIREPVFTMVRMEVDG